MQAEAAARKYARGTATGVSNRMEPGSQRVAAAFSWMQERHGLRADGDVDAAGACNDPLRAAAGRRDTVSVALWIKR